MVGATFAPEKADYHSVTVDAENLFLLELCNKWLEQTFLSLMQIEDWYLGGVDASFAPEKEQLIKVLIKCWISFISLIFQWQNKWILKAIYNTHDPWLCWPIMLIQCGFYARIFFYKFFTRSQKKKKVPQLWPINMSSFAMPKKELSKMRACP